MNNTLKSIALGFVASLMIVAPAAAAKPTAPGGTPSPTVLTGNDVSWPQCGKHMTLPSGQAFGIVGVNGGLANTTNPCFAQELSWASASSGKTNQPTAALYVNTANPGNLGVADWPKSGSSVKYGGCTGSDDQACAYVYGWNMAQLDATSRGVSSPAAYTWWLDVETGNSWESNTANNAADLEGMTDYFQSIGAGVGLYSTNYQWGQIAGAVSATSSLNGLPSWLAGASSVSGAQANCKLPGLTTNSQVTLAQYVSRSTDYDVSCI
ncbi:MAG TPA: hypothetical protein VN031_00520 [Candidatus Microsaccharimonas sp.]|nr:hypothetical protein [Candidatus Microsaccharimonas sp.]